MDNLKTPHSAPVTSAAESNVKSTTANYATHPAKHSGSAPIGLGMPASALATSTNRENNEHAGLVNPYAAALGANVERLRRRSKITKTRFAEMLGIGRPLLNKIESGAANPRLGLICRMAEALGVSPQDLLAPPKPEPAPAPQRMRLTPRGHLIPDDGYRPPRR